MLHTMSLGIVVVHDNYLEITEGVEFRVKGDNILSGLYNFQTSSICSYVGVGST